MSGEILLGVHDDDCHDEDISCGIFMTKPVTQADHVACESGDQMASTSEAASQQLKSGLQCSGPCIELATGPACGHLLRPL